MTTKDMGSIEEGLRLETVCAKKIHAYHHEVQDPELRQLLEECEHIARRHFQQLYSEVQG